MSKNCFLVLCLLLLGIICTPVVEAAPINISDVVTIINNDTLHMRNDSEIRNLTGFNKWIVKEGYGITFDESDDRFNLSAKLISNQMTQIRWVSVGDRSEREHTLYYCTSSEIIDYDRFIYRTGDIKGCPKNYYQYKMKDLKEGQAFNLKHPPLNENGSAYALWFVGGKGFNWGAASSSGLPICEGLSAGLTLNQTNGTIVFDTEATLHAGFIGPQAGCSVTSIRLQFKNSGGGWQVVPQFNDSEAVDCKGVNCIITTSNFGNYYRIFRCDISKNVSLRTVLSGAEPGDPRATSISAIKKLECLNPVVLLFEDDDAWLALLAVGSMIIFFLLMWKVDDNEEAKKEEERRGEV